MGRAQITLAWPAPITGSQSCRAPAGVRRRLLAAKSVLSWPAGRGGVRFLGCQMGWRLVDGRGDARRWAFGCPSMINILSTTKITFSPTALQNYRLETTGSAL